MQFLLLKKGGFLDAYFCLGCKVSIYETAGSPYSLVPLLVYMTTKRIGLPFYKDYER